jgi:uncharacterized protein
VFLDHSHRMHPALCTVVGHLAYDGELGASQAASTRSISGPDLHAASSVIPVRPGVAWVPVDGGEEAEAIMVVTLIDRLMAGTVVTNEKGVRSALDADEILVVAPHNAHVNRIKSKVGNNVRVGTVDKFQGQQAHVVIYSMGRQAETPRDVSFLYELNRVNVALSRARLMSVVVSHPDSVFPPVNGPEHLRLASRFSSVLKRDCGL